MDLAKEKTRYALSPDTDLLIMSKSAAVSSTYGRYARIALCEVQKGVTPKMISERARGMIRIIEKWERCSVGTTERCAFARAFREAQREAETLCGKS